MHRREARAGATVPGLRMGAALSILAAACTAGGDSAEALAERAAVCGECSIERSVVWASTPRDPEVRLSGIFIERSDELWVMGGYSDETVVRFDLGGGPGRGWTRRGDGPGEFADQITGGTLHRSGDTLLIAENHRLQYFTGDLAFERGVRLAVRPRGAMVATGGGTVVVSNTIPRRLGAETETLHAFDGRGGPVASWRPTDSLVTATFVPLALGADPGTVWAAYASRTGAVLELWSVPERSLRHRLRLTIDWWYVAASRGREAEAAPRREGRPERLRPESGVTGLHDDGSTLWVTVRHATEKWAEARAAEESTLDQRFDSFVLALDRTDGRVLAAEPLDGFAFGFTNRGRLVVHRLDSDGHPSLRLESVALRR